MNQLVERIYAYKFDLAPKDSSGVSIPGLLDKIVSTMGYIAGFLAVIYLVWSGIKYITANGDAEAAKKGQTGIINAIIGIVVIILAYSIFTAVSSYSKNLV